MLHKSADSGAKCREESLEILFLWVPPSLLNRLKFSKGGLACKEWHGAPVLVDAQNVPEECQAKRTNNGPGVAPS
eukprot:1165261-Amphidinium_carterae.1